MPLLLIPSTHLLCGNLISYPKRDQFVTLDTFPACLQKQGTSCAKYGYTSTLLVRCVTNLRSWSSQFSILIVQLQITLRVTCNFIEAEKKPGTCFWTVIEIFSLLLVNS